MALLEFGQCECRPGGTFMLLYGANNWPGVNVPLDSAIVAVGQYTHTGHYIRYTTTG